jgi:hypothetical protein
MPRCAPRMVEPVVRQVTSYALTCFMTTLSGDNVISLEVTIICTVVQFAVCALVEETKAASTSKANANRHFMAAPPRVMGLRADR